MNFNNYSMENAIEDNSGLIYKICSKYNNYFDKEDLYQQGIIGLINAYNNYNEKMNTKFSTYAFPYIVGEINNYVRINKNIKISHEIIRLGRKINEYIEKHKKIRGYNPDLKDIAKLLGISLEKVVFAIEASNPIKSFDEKINDEGKEINLKDVISIKDTISKDQLLDLKEAFKFLSQDERILLINRYFNDLTQNEIANLMGVNQVYVSRLEKKALVKMKSKMS